MASKTGKRRKTSGVASRVICKLHHDNDVTSLAWSPDGLTLVCGSVDHKVRVWDIAKGQCVRTLTGHANVVRAVSITADGQKLLSGGRDGTLEVWELATGRLLQTLAYDQAATADVAWSPDGTRFAAAFQSGLVVIVDADSYQRLEVLNPNPEGVILSIAWTADSRLLACAGHEVWLWDTRTARLITPRPSSRLNYQIAWSSDASSRWLAAASTDSAVRIWDRISRNEFDLEGHTSQIRAVAFSNDGRLLASASDDRTVHIWDCTDWRLLHVIPSSSSELVAFHPSRPWLTRLRRDHHTVEIQELDVDRLIARPTAAPSVNYTTAKIVIVGDSGVGKTGLGWRLAHGHFKEHASTHGQQFWVLDQLRTSRSDGTECEAILWDLAGQPDYRMIHALFVDDADLALVVFDPTHVDDPMKGVEFWLKQLRVGTGENAPPAILIPARVDRGTGRLTADELAGFCRRRGLGGCIPTSAASGQGVAEVISRMKDVIRWDEKPATVTTATFKRIKDYVLRLKEDRRRKKLILTPAELRKRLVKTHPKWSFTEDEMLSAVGHLAKHGYVALLKTSRGEPRVLLAPDLLNNVAASLVLIARGNPKGLGSLEEQSLVEEKYPIPDLKNVARADREILVDSAAALFLEHNVCFRETDPLSSRSYLVFPELINLKKPTIDDDATEEGVAYTVSGAIENVYASLVVLLGYTDKFTRTNQWRNHARYEVGGGLVCGFRLEGEREGELDLVLYFGRDVGAPIRTLFQSLFESFLARRNLTVLRLEPVVCSNGHPLNRAVVREHATAGEEQAFCSKCGDRLRLPDANEPIQLTRQEAADVDEQRRGADQRSLFEQAIFRLKTYVTEHHVEAPECFMSYAWGDSEQERWVERLATDLLKSGIRVVLDRWENTRIGASVARFVERVEKSDCVIVIGTPLYRQKYENKEPMRGFVVAAEGDLIGRRMIGTEARKQSVLPVLLDGNEDASLPAILGGRVYADFREASGYFTTALDLMFSLYDLDPRHPLVTDLRELLRVRMR